MNSPIGDALKFEHDKIKANARGKVKAEIMHWLYQQRTDKMSKATTQLLNDTMEMVEKL